MREQGKLENDARATLLQGLGTLVAIAGLIVTLRVNNQRGQTTERFVSAINQLGNNQLEVRLGGIYALEQIARDSASQALESQLYGQYMLPAGTQHGIYLVGWYDPADWDEADRNRRQRVVGKTPAGLKAHFDQQAARLRDQGAIVEPLILDGSLRLAADS